MEQVAPRRSAAAQIPTVVARQLEEKPAHRRAEAHPVAGAARIVRCLREHRRKPVVGRVQLVAATAGVGGDEAQPALQLAAGGVSEARLPVGVVEPFTGVAERQPRRVGAVAVNQLPDGVEVAARLGHLFAVDQHPAVDRETTRPLFAGKDGGVVEEAERKMVLDKVLAAHAQVVGIPVFEFGAPLRDLLRVDARYRGGVAVAEERLEEFLAQLCSRQRIDMVRDGVVRHVDSRVAQRLDDPFLVPRQPRSQALLARASPVAQPAEHVLELSAHLAREKRHRAERLAGACGPRFVVVFQEPLVLDDFDGAVGEPAAARRPGQLVIARGVTTGDERCAHLLARRVHRQAGAAHADRVKHRAVLEAVQVELLLSLLQPGAVVLVAHAHLPAERWRRNGPELARIDNRERLYFFYMFMVKTPLFAQRSRIL